MSFLERITTDQLDLLKEIGNIGAGNAATALSMVLDKPIDMQVPSVRVISFEDTINLAGGAENVVASVFLRLEGDVKGSMFYILSIEQAECFVRLMTGLEDFIFEKDPYSEIGLSALQELGNILAGSYLSSLSDFTKINLCPTVPKLSIEMAGAVIGTGLLELSRAGDHAIVIDTAFQDRFSERMEWEGHFLLLPDPDSFPVLFRSLGVSEYD